MPSKKDYKKNQRKIGRSKLMHKTPEFGRILVSVLIHWHYYSVAAEIVE